MLTVSVEQQAAWIRNFNPFAAGGARWPTQGGIYEPLMIFNSMTGAWVPWLATGYTWGQDNRTLTLSIRDGVKFSDGQPMTASDVVFSFQLRRRFAALDQGAVWRFLDPDAGVERVGAREVRFTFARPYAPGLAAIAHSVIVPEHIWRHIADPVRFTNDNPVATGPFTEVLRFENQLFELGPNPHYWQKGKPAISALRMPAFPSNDQANMALVTGEVDWAGNFVPAVERTFVSRDPAHHGYWFPLTGSTVFLYANTTREPFDDPRVRRALSMAIDRQRLVDIAMYTYTRPADGTGLSQAYDRWRDPSAVAAGRQWMRHDVAAANALLDRAGFAVGQGGMRRTPGGSPWESTIYVVSGWSDWIRAAQVISRDLRAIGLDAKVRVFDFSPWFDKLQTGAFDLAVGWSNEGPTPYAFYRWLMSTRTVKPLGEASLGNWHRYGSADADALLDAFEATTDHDAQRRLVGQLQQLFVRDVPAIPLFPNPNWGLFSTARISGFPTADDPYATLSPNKLPEALLVMTRLVPTGSAGSSGESK